MRNFQKKTSNQDKENYISSGTDEATEKCDWTSFHLLFFLMNTIVYRVCKLIF